MANASFDLAVVERPHTAALPGIATTGGPLSVIFATFEQIRHGFLGDGQWDAAEVPLGRLIALKADGDDTLTAIPVFPWRSFRHGAIYVRNDGLVRQPADLAGRRVGVTDWHQTAGIVARGLLAREYGVPLGRIDWVSGSLDGRPRRALPAVSAPLGVSISATESSLELLLETGGIDAIISADAPKGAAPLFHDHEALEHAWYGQTGIFPLMHVIAVRRSALEKLASLDDFQRVFEAAKSASTVSSDPKWRYGLANNAAALDRLLIDAYAQGIGARLLQPHDLFG